MKNTVTISICLPITISDQVDKMVEDMHISRSALLTAIVSLFIKWISTSTAKKELLNSLYGKKE